MSAGHERSTREKVPERSGQQVLPASYAGGAPVAVHGLATGVRRRTVGDDPLGGTVVAPEVGTALRRRQGGGRPLDPEHADRMGAALGVDLGGVRIHDDGEADAIARSVQATAFTAGSDVYFTRGTYAPGTSGGDHLLAHELAHVVQASSGPSSAQGPVIGAANDPVEAAADAMADSAVGRLRRQSARASTATAPTPTGSADSLAPLRRRAEQAGTVRRWNPFKALFGGKKKKLSTTAPVPSPVTNPVVPQVVAQVVSQVSEPPTKPAKPPRRPKPLPKVPVAAPQVADPSSTTTPDLVTTPTVEDSGSATVTDSAATTVADAVTTPVEDPVAVTADDLAATTVVDPVASTLADPVASAVADPVATPPPVPKSAKERFEEACDPQTAPASKDEAKARMGALRVLTTAFSTAEKAAVATDAALMAKGRVHLGDLHYMSLLAAVDTNVQKTGSDGAQVKHHLTGAEADTFITTNINDYPHLKPFIQAAADAGKKGEGYVASVSPADWAIVFGVEVPGVTDAFQQTVNAFTSTKNDDMPAILHADRGTPSTAIHESMHRYAPLTVLTTLGFNFNEGVTEYFTRKLTDQNARPAKDNGAERTNYQAQVTFVREMLRILGATEVDRETVLAQIYFDGAVALLGTKYKAACKAKTSTLSDGELETAWLEFEGHVKKGEWSQAKSKLPAP